MNLLRLLIIEDNPDDYVLLQRHLKKNGMETESLRIETEGELITSLQDVKFDAIISDNSLPTLNAARALQVVRSIDKSVPFIILSGSIEKDQAIKAMYEGANDYLVKNDMSKLAPVLMREINEAKNREMKLVAEESYKSLAKSITDVFFAIDNRYQITFWNEAAAKQFDHTKDEVLGKSVFDLVPTLKDSDLGKAFVYALDKKISRYTPFDYRHKKNGRYFQEYFECSIYPSNFGASIILKKVTQQRNVERDLRKSNLELETLIYRMSHDIKGPVASMKGLINLGKLEFNNPTLLEFLSRQSVAANNLERILNELMNISKIKGGTQQFEKLNLRQLIDGVLGSLQYKENYNQVTIKPDFDEELEMVGDHSLITSIFQNLIDNALKYADYEGLPSVQIEARKSGACTYISIVDNGVGIPLGHEGKIFEMFYRANEQSTGSGLGLFIVKSALDKIGGTVRYKPNSPKGCHFELTIPDIKKPTKNEPVVEGSRFIL